MKRRKNAESARTGLDLAEEAVHLVRRTPLAGWVAYFTGALPFILGLLYFWSDMSRGAYARDHLVGGSLLLALLFVWMKCWQCVATNAMFSVLSDEPPPRWTAGRIARMALVQATLQPVGLIARPIALLITVPYGWTHAFFQNVVILGNGGTARTAEVMREARRAAALWPNQNHTGLATFCAFAIFIWLDVAAAMLLAPSLLKTFLGVETMFTRSAWSLLNTTFFASVCGAAYLCVDPFLKAFYTLRCFYGRSLESGHDLRIELKRLRARAGAALLVLALFPAAAAAQPAADAGELDRRIEQVMEEPEFAWRQPRESRPAKERGFVGTFLSGVIETVRDWLRPLEDWLERLIEWIIKRNLREPRSSETAAGWLGALEILVYAAGALVLAAGVFLIWRRWRSGRGDREITPEIVDAAPDLASEGIVADQLPEDEWLRLAREMIERGDLRLAFRALYLAGLAHLGRQKLVTIARHKSNSEYVRELRRRARARDILLAAFHENVNAFERVWYGDHAATEEALHRFNLNLEQIRTAS